MTSLFTSPLLGDTPASLIRPLKLARPEGELDGTTPLQLVPPARLTHSTHSASRKITGMGAECSATGSFPSSVISAFSLPPPRLDDKLEGQSPTRSASPGMPIRIVSSPSGNPQQDPMFIVPGVALQSRHTPSSSSRILPYTTDILGLPIAPVHNGDCNDGIPRSMRSLRTTMASATAKPPLPPHLLFSKSNRNDNLHVETNDEQDDPVDWKESVVGSEADTLRPGTYARELGEYHHILAALPRSHQSSLTAKPQFISPLGITAAVSPVSPDSPRFIDNDQSSADTVDEQCQGGVDEIGVEWCFFCQRVFSRSKMILEDTPGSGTQWMCGPCCSSKGIRRGGGEMPSSGMGMGRSAW